MLVNSVKHNNEKCYLSITFFNEIEEHIFLQNILYYFVKILPVNCVLTDLDTNCSTYERYFERNNYYVFDRLTTVSIFAFDLTWIEIKEVVSNWGYFTIDAIFALGTIDDELKNHKLDITNIFQSLPIVINQVLDNSVEIIINQCYFEDVFKIIKKNK